jgi:DNA gyrase subunit B
MNYTEKNIKVLKGLDAVKKRPGMYIGNTEDGSGLHRMLFEILDNALDEYYAGFCTKIIITLHTNGSVTINDDGRGIPTELFRNTTKTTAEVILTTLHSGAKFDNNTYKFSSGLHGVGLSVVNALSKNLTLTVVKKNILFIQKYENGTLLSTNYVKNNIGKKQGTIIQFTPNQTIIKPTFFSIQIINQRLEELSFLNKDIVFEFIDENTNVQHTFRRRHRRGPGLRVKISRCRDDDGVRVLDRFEEVFGAVNRAGVGEIGSDITGRRTPRKVVTGDASQIRN